MTRSGFTLDSNWVAAKECGVAVAKDGFAGEDHLRIALLLRREV